MIRASFADVGVRSSFSGLALAGVLDGLGDEAADEAKKQAKAELRRRAESKLPGGGRIFDAVLSGDKVAVERAGLSLAGLPENFVTSSGAPDKYQIVAWGLTQAGLPVSFVNRDLTPNTRAIIAWAVRRIELRSAVAPTFSFGLSADAPPPEPKPEKPGGKFDVGAVMRFVKPEVKVTTAAGVVDVAPFGKSALGEGEEFFATWKRRLLLAAAGVGLAISGTGYGIYRFGKWRGR